MQPKRSNLVVAFHGGQGSGKSRLTNYAFDLLRERYFTLKFGIKNTFNKYALKVAEDLGMDYENKDLLAYKELQKAISCAVEMHWNKSVWSDRYREEILQCYPEHAVISDDIRTIMNLDALRQLTVHRRVFLFRLMASEEVRRSRCSAWRENAGYTELLLERPAALPANFTWVDINTELPIENSYRIIGETLDSV